MKFWMGIIIVILMNINLLFFCYIRLGNNYGNNNYRDENYHDYMNADALSAPHAHAPLYQSGLGPGQPSPPTTQQDITSSQDQRLLSVSGKKKCSHCSEELG